MTAQGMIVRFDPLTNKDHGSINVGPNGGWCSVEALPNGRYVNVRMERMRQGLELAQRGAVTLPEDGEDLSAVVRSGHNIYQVDTRLLTCPCADYQKHLQASKHLLATEAGGTDGRTATAAGRARCAQEAARGDHRHPTAASQGRHTPAPASSPEAARGVPMGSPASKLFARVSPRQSLVKCASIP